MTFKKIRFRFRRLFVTPDSSLQINEQSKLSLESGKLAFDLYKHLITLNSGLFMVLIALIKLVNDEDGSKFDDKFWIVVSLSSSGISIIGCLFLLVIIVIDCKSNWQFGAKDDSNLQNFISLSLTVIAWGFFLFSLLSLIMFAMKNFL